MQANRQAEGLLGGGKPLPGRDLAQALPPSLGEKLRGLWLKLIAEGRISEELAGAAAHELNQPLTALSATAEMMEIYQDPANLQRLAGKVRAEVDRLAELVARLGKIVRYESQPYLGQTRIIDIKKASQED